MPTTGSGKAFRHEKREVETLEVMKKYREALDNAHAAEKAEQKARRLAARRQVSAKVLRKFKAEIYATAGALEYWRNKLTPLIMKLGYVPGRDDSNTTPSPVAPSIY